MITAIEQAMVARAQAASAADVFPYKLGTVTTYGGELDGTKDADAARKELREIVRKFPAMWITFAGAPGRYKGNGHSDFVAQFVVLVAAEHAANEQAARHGAGAARPGSHQLAQDAVRIFADNCLGLEISPLRPIEIRPIFTEAIRRENISVLAVAFETMFAIEAVGSVGVVGDGPGDDLLGVHIDWDVPVFAGHVAVPVPAGEADAEDDVTLEGAGP